MVRRGPHFYHGRRAMLAAAPFLAFAPLARAQTLADVEQREASVIEAWNKTPLLVRRAIFTTVEAIGFGVYVQRPNTRFRPGEELRIYCEPVGYAFKQTGTEWDFGLALDFLLKSTDGMVLGGKEDFGRFAFRSHLQNRELKLTVNVSLSGARPGDYVLEIRLRDLNGPKATSFNLPFSIEA